MTDPIRRIETGARMSQAVVHGGVVWLADIGDYDAVNAVWDAWIPPGCAPARACGETKLAGEGYAIEIICAAALA